MSKINELKQLEMMASPYNQSLISMIKEEQEYNKSKKRNQDMIKTGRNTKDQKRND